MVMKMNSLLVVCNLLIAFAIGVFAYHTNVELNMLLSLIFEVMIMMMMFTFAISTYRNNRHLMVKRIE
ncbi:hypothetical protein [Niallia oryzisoli]|uniref:hypothetical protein n=1 Tax=Niallia oryzisoli TaxID=1737571 RepID=UPI003736BA4E